LPLSYMLGLGTVALNRVVHCWALVQSVIILLCKNVAGAPNYQS
jgi:hypothetical protein